MKHDTLNVVDDDVAATLLRLNTLTLQLQCDDWSATRGYLIMGMILLELVRDQQWRYDAIRGNVDELEIGDLERLKLS